eukprot:CAMPEP_0206475372 /NCGR_PEP_ID=MMETSP0324_2-20121206/34034_1 /ASSEMBLY_ACC=CAM_ASM_000836 /TAXON_ID=2866 /ORGANISM="Crypthecodinium cohnii, Strain Seligo" /LENGTH=135 /DNA_ID=CAMNT_0053950705 /DNA_START=56 /DNA_END=460 /DNA_ORIENTATION=-
MMATPRSARIRQLDPMTVPQMMRGITLRHNGKGVVAQPSPRETLKVTIENRLDHHKEWATMAYPTLCKTQELENTSFLKMKQMRNKHERIQQSPRERFVEPTAESMVYGWHGLDDSKPRVAHPRTQCHMTRHQDN